LIVAGGKGMVTPRLRRKIGGPKPVGNIVLNGIRIILIMLRKTFDLLGFERLCRNRAAER